MTEEQLRNCDICGTPTYRFLADKYNTAMISPKQFAEEWGSHPTQVRKLCRDGAIRARRVGGNRWMIPLDAAAAFLEGGGNYE